jgi:predicted phage-related endonuclease
MINLLKQYYEIKKDQKILSAKEKELKQKILGSMGENNTYTQGKFIAIVQKVTKSILNGQKLKAEKAEIYNAYLRQSDSIILKVVEK